MHIDSIALLGSISWTEILLFDVPKISGFWWISRQCRNDQSGLEGSGRGLEDMSFYDMLVTSQHLPLLPSDFLTTADLGEIVAV